MTRTVIILADGPARGELASQFGPSMAPLYSCLLHDTVAVAGSLRRSSVIVRPGSAAAQESVLGLGPEVALARPGTPAAALLAESLAEGPALAMGGDLPHLPPWRLRDAFTHLEAADVVIGPCERSGWYLLGLRRAVPELLRAMPALDEPSEELTATAAVLGLSVRYLPTWFRIKGLSELAALADSLRTMPPHVAPATRSLLGAGASRAVGG